MIIQKYLIINSRGNVTVREREARLDGNEISLRLSIEVPDAFFRRPELVATLKVPAEAIPKTKVTTEMTDNIEKLVKAATGLTVAVNFLEQEGPEDNKKKNLELLKSLGFKKDKEKNEYVLRKGIRSLIVPMNMVETQTYEEFYGEINRIMI